MTCVSGYSGWTSRSSRPRSGLLLPTSESSDAVAFSTGSSRDQSIGWPAWPGELAEECTLSAAVAFAERVDRVDFGEEMGEAVDEYLP